MRPVEKEMLEQLQSTDGDPPRETRFSSRITVISISYQSLHVLSHSIGESDKDRPSEGSKSKKEDPFTRRLDLKKIRDRRLCDYHHHACYL